MKLVRSKGTQVSTAESGKNYFFFFLLHTTFFTLKKSWIISCKVVVFLVEPIGERKRLTYSKRIYNSLASFSPPLTKREHIDPVIRAEQFLQVQLLEHEILYFKTQSNIPSWWWISCKNLRSISSNSEHTLMNIALGRANTPKRTFVSRTLPARHRKSNRVEE